jgi:hypothetical protein
MIKAIYDLREYGFFDCSDGIHVIYSKIVKKDKWEVEELVNEYHIRKNTFLQAKAYSLNDLELILKNKYKLLNDNE